MTDPHTPVTTDEPREPGETQTPVDYEPGPPGDELVVHPGARTAGPFAARYGKFYRNARYIMVAVVVGMGLWFLYDGLVDYPRENEEILRLDAQIAEAGRAEDTEQVARLTALRQDLPSTPHSESDIMLQIVLGVTLPPLGLAYLAYMMHRSRGTIQLDGGVLSAPGHPPVPVEQITAIDKKLWDRKGIAFVHYKLPDGQSGAIRLDDFIYDRPPTDAIYGALTGDDPSPRRHQDGGGGTGNSTVAAVAMMGAVGGSSSSCG